MTTHVLSREQRKRNGRPQDHAQTQDVAPHRRRSILGREVENGEDTQMIKTPLKIHALARRQRREKERRGGANRKEVAKAIDTKTMRTRKTKCRKKGMNLNRLDSEKVQCGRRLAEEVVRVEEDGLEVIFHAEEEEVAA